MKQRALSLGVIGSLAFFAWSSDAVAHTKGLTLSRFGLIDVSLQANVAYVNFDDPKKVDFDKIGDRHSKGFNLTSFDLSLSGQVPEFPLKFAMFLTFEQDKASIEEAFLFFHKLEEFSPVLADFQATVGQFRAKFGQFNQIHDHEWFLADPPLIHTKFLGVDGVHLLGAEVTYQVPIPYFLQLSLSVQSKGALDGFPAATSSTPPTFALRTAGAGSWPYIRWLTEAIWAVRENPIVQAGANKGLQVDSDVVGGFFSEVGYRFSQHWQVTGRVDYVGIPKGNEDEHLRLTGGLRYLITPIAKIGLQYEYSAPSGRDKPYSAVFVQFNVGLGTVTPGVGKFLDPF